MTNRGPGRPRKPKDIQLTERISVRITKAEHDALLAHALDNKRKIADLVRIRMAELLTDQTNREEMSR